ncbi:hypothetical protein H0E87_027862 [Populus deltoides]|uniref:Uncharacterized protein n=1 Tax=Populus deltoides TaxID=3696 RepID=A0A8T2WS61_POPDE|nr:hypothetical protein H0E87_027862 [Populus deltoides]
MVAAMANFLGYDVYDLELTTVKDNSDLRKLLIETTGKSIIVIEDIDCSLDLTGQRKKKEKDENDAETGKEKDPISKKKREAEEESKRTSKVTLSGLEFHRWNLSCWGRQISTADVAENVMPKLRKQTENGEASSSKEEVAVKEDGVTSSKEVKQNGVIAQG